MAKRQTRRTGAERRAYRDAMLDKAADTLGRIGIRDTTMDEIAEDIGLSKVALYRHFASKDEMIHCVLEREANRLLEIDRLPYKGGTARARELLEAARQDRSAFILLLRDARYDPVYGEHAQNVFDSVADRLREAFLHQSVEEPIAGLSADAISNLVLSATVYWLEKGDSDRDDEFIAWYGAAVRALDDGWRKALASETDG